MGNLPTPEDEENRELPLTVEECETLRAAVLEGSVEPNLAHNRLIAAIRGGRLWRTPEWRRLRAELIGQKCEQCGSDEGPFTLQHLWQPTPVGDLEKQLRSAHRSAAREKFDELNPLDDLGDVEVADGAPLQCCPKCGGFNIAGRVKSPYFRCQTQRNKKVCGHAFDEPAVRIPTRVITPVERQREAFSVLYNKFYQEVGGRMFYQQAVAIALDDFAAYMSGEGTATFCKRCAFMWDQKGLQLCGKCHENWVFIGVDLCEACTGAKRYVTCAVCGVRRHSDRYPTCFECRMT